MSKKNRERRAVNKRRKGEQARATARTKHNSGRRADPRTTRDGTGAPSADEMIWAALAALRQDRSRLQHLAAVLADAGTDVLDRLSGLLSARVATLWTRGWTPVDVVRAASRVRGSAFGDLAAGVAVEDGRSRLRRGEHVDPAWQAQLDQLSVRADLRLAADVDVSLGLLEFASRLGHLPRTIPAPGERWARRRPSSGRLDEGLLGRVRGLLAKAESTEFEAEAEALTAKAQELIARHAIDVALLAQPEDLEEAAVRRIPVDDPYADAKSLLLSRVADANRCEAVYSRAFGWSDVFGFDSDLDGVELLFASLLAQATGAMARHGSRVDVYGRSSTRSFRRSFLVGFANRIGERLRETTETQVARVASVDAGVLPVLASRDEHVREARNKAFPRLVSKRTSVSNETGYYAGQAAADQAELGVPSGRLRAG